MARYREVYGFAGTVSLLRYLTLSLYFLIYLPFSQEWRVTDVVLDFPVDGAGGPFWDDDGRLDLVPCKERDQEEVGVGPLGGNRYRLAERQPGPFSGLRLYWGDEFNGDKGEDGTLRLTSVCGTRPYTYFCFLTSGGFNNEHQLTRGGSSPTKAASHQYN